MAPRVDFVIDGVVAAMGHPGGGAALRARLEALCEAGIDAIISLSLCPPEVRTIEKAHFRHLHVPVPDFSAPTVEDFDRIVDFINSVVEPGGAAVVHCTSGYGRTGTVVAGYLMVREGLSAEEAIRRVRERRPGSIETESQEEAVAAYEAVLTARAAGGDLERGKV